MTETLAVDHLVTRLHRQLAARPDDRQGKKTPYAINEAALGACAVFCTQSPSLWASQRTRPQATGRRNAESLCGILAIPCDQQIRTWLDPVAPAEWFRGLPEGMTPWTVQGRCPTGGGSRTSG